MNAGSECGCWSGHNLGDRVRIALWIKYY
jgi:hypothetical protein